MAESRRKVMPRTCALAGAVFPGLVAIYPAYVRLGCTLGFLRGIPGGMPMECGEIGWSFWWMSSPFLPLLAVLHIIAVLWGVALLSVSDVRNRSARSTVALLALEAGACLWAFPVAIRGVL